MRKRKIKISRTFLTGYKSIPLIRLQGIWLEKLGFIEGNYIEVNEYQGLITIRLLDNQNPND